MIVLGCGISDAFAAYQTVTHDIFGKDALGNPIFVQGGGALIVSNIGAVAPTAGDSFKRFNAASYSTSFGDVPLPPLPAGFGWNTTSLNTNGMLSVMVVAEPFIHMVSP